MDRPAKYGWRPVFIVFGCVSLLWLLPWSRVEVPKLIAAVGPSLRPPSLRQILRQRSLWGACLGMFSANYSFYFILAWLPFYLVKARGLSIESMAWTASWAYLLNAVAALWMGWLTDRKIRAGAVEAGGEIDHRAIVASLEFALLKRGREDADTERFAEHKQVSDMRV